MPGTAESEALDLFFGKCVAQHDILLQHRVRLGLRHCTALQFRIQERSGGTQQAQLQRQQLAFHRFVRLHDVLGVQPPAFSVSGVEGIQRPREADAVLYHGIELQFVAGPRLMCSQRPRHRIEGEVVVLIFRTTRCRRNIQRQHELAALSGVVQERRRRHMRRRLLRGLGRGRQPNDRRTAGQCDQILCHDDFFDLVQSIFKEGQNRLAGDLLFLQFGNDGAIVARWITIGLRYARRQRRHLGLVLHKGGMRHLRDLRRRDVDAVSFERQNIFLRRQTEISARLGQYVGLDPGVVVG